MPEDSCWYSSVLLCMDPLLCSRLYCTVSSKYRFHYHFITYVSHSFNTIIKNSKSRNVWIFICEQDTTWDFDVLLTVHLSIFILVINQLDAQNFCFTISLFHACTCYEHHALIVRRSKLYHTASGIITPIGGRLVHRLRVLSQPVHRKATYRCDDTRCCMVEFWPPDDEHICSKHVEEWNNLIIKFSATSWLILR